jgi:hypothetical protein
LETTVVIVEVVVVFAIERGDCHVVRRTIPSTTTVVSHRVRPPQSSAPSAPSAAHLSGECKDATVELHIEGGEVIHAT